MKYRIEENIEKGKIIFYPQYKDKYRTTWQYWLDYDHEGYSMIQFKSLKEAREFIKEKKSKPVVRYHDE